MKIEVLGFDEMKDLYEIDPSFYEPWRAPNISNQLSKYKDYFN